MKLEKKVLLTLCSMIIVGSSTLVASEKSAFDIADKVYQTIGSMQSYAFDAVVTDQEMKEGTPIQKHRRDISVKVLRPGSLRVDAKGDFRDRSTYIHNGLFTILDHKEGYYGQLKTADTTDGALDDIFETYGISAPLASLIYSDMDKRVKFKKGKYFGVVDLAGTACDYVAFRSNVREIHAWITRGENPKVIHYSIIDIAQEGKPRTNTTIYWKKSLKIDTSDFVFRAPKGASKISIRPAS